MELVAKASLLFHHPLVANVSWPKVQQFLISSKRRYAEPTLFSRVYRKGGLPPSKWSQKGALNTRQDKRWKEGVTPIESSSSSSNDGTSTSQKNAKVPMSTASAIQFLTLIQRLKTTKRTGWVNHGVKESESIADHMYRMAVMAIISGDLPGVNKDRCVKMAVVHDIAEAIVGDITPNDNISKEDKNRLESAAIDEMCVLLEGGIGANEIKELWQEYESNSTPEAKFVKDLDKLEMILQAVEYESEQDKILEDFFQSTKGKFQTDLGKAWAAEITKRKPKQK